MKMKLSDTYEFTSDVSAVWADIMGYTDITRYQGGPFEVLRIETPDDEHYNVIYEGDLEVRVTILEKIPEQKFHTSTVVIDKKGRENNKLELEYLLEPISGGGCKLTFRRQNEMKIGAWVFTKAFRKKDDLFGQQMKARLGEA